MINKIKRLLYDMRYQQYCITDRYANKQLAEKQSNSERGIDKVDKLIKPQYFDICLN